jgi:hypothetical protein
VDEGRLVGLINIESLHCLGEKGRLVGLSNIESLHCLLPKPGLVAGFLVDAESCWNASFGTAPTSPSHRFFLSFLSVFKHIGPWESSIPIALRFMFRRLSEGNLGASWTMETSPISTSPITSARRLTRKEESIARGLFPCLKNVFTKMKWGILLHWGDTS